MSQFVDECNLHVSAGDGGAGCVAFRREAHVDRGGANGGNGGNGGDVWLVADNNVASLLAFRDHPHRRAENGRHGGGSDRHGARGADLEVKVPVGTTVAEHPNTASNESETSFSNSSHFDHASAQLVDLDTNGSRWLAARAGLGGRGNAHFVSRMRKAPSFCEQGEHGEQRWLRLELKLMADVAIIGFPNVGKSTFISRVSAAKPKIADYPFTTLEPNLGVARIDDMTELVLADIPGLISGAADGKGLGHRFLRHTERARVLLILIDISDWCETSPVEQHEVLLTELDRYRPELLERPRLVVASRSDMADGMADTSPMDSVSDKSMPESIRHRVSAVTGQGITETMRDLTSLVQKARSAESHVPVEVIHRPVSDELTAQFEGQGFWRLEGRAALRAVLLSDMTNPEALTYALNRLDSLGANKVLARAGAASGDIVRVGDFEFEYEPDN